MADLLRPTLVGAQVLPRATAEFIYNIDGEDYSESTRNTLTDSVPNEFSISINGHLDQDSGTECYIKIVTTKKCNLYRMTVFNAENRIISYSEDIVRSNEGKKFSITPATYERLHDDDDNLLWSRLVTGLEPGEYALRCTNCTRDEVEFFFEEYDSEKVSYTGTTIIKEFMKGLVSYFPVQYGYFFTDVQNRNSLGFYITSDTGTIQMYKDDGRNYLSVACDGYFIVNGFNKLDMLPYTFPVPGNGTTKKARSCALSFDFKADYTVDPGNSSGILDFNLARIGQFVLTVRWQSGGQGNLGMLDMSNYDSIATSTSKGYPPVLPLDGEWHTVVVSSNEETGTTTVIIDGICKVKVHHIDFNLNVTYDNFLMIVGCTCNKVADANYNTIPKGFRNICYYSEDIIGDVNAGDIVEMFKTENFNNSTVETYTPVTPPKETDKTSSMVSINGSNLNDGNDKTNFEFSDGNTVDITLNEDSDIYAYGYTGGAVIITNKETGEVIYCGEPSGAEWQKIASDVKPGIYEISVPSGGVSNITEIFTAVPKKDEQGPIVPTFSKTVKKQVKDQVIKDTDNLVRYSVVENGQA